MTIDYGPFDAGIGANRTEEWWRAYFRHLTGSAVVEGERSEFAVAERAAGANMSVDVAAGTAFIRGHWIDSDATENKTIAAADATNPRKDRVVLRADFTANTISIEVLTGTPAGSPTVPALTQSTSRWEIALATVDVAANETAIETAHLTDERTLYPYGITTTADNLTTAETDTSKALRPDGAGGVEWGADTVDQFTLLALAPDVSNTNFDTTVVDSSRWFNQRRWTGASGAQNDEIVFAVPPLEGGTWRFDFYHWRTSDFGIYTIAESPDASAWTDLTTVDGYAASGVATRSKLTGLTVTAGTQYLRLKMATKNASSTGYKGDFSALFGRRTGA